MAICGLPVQVHQLSLTFFNEFLLAELVLLPHAASRTTAAEMAATARAIVAGRRRRLISILPPLPVSRSGGSLKVPGWDSPPTQWFHPSPAAFRQQPTNSNSEGAKFRWR